MERAQYQDYILNASVDEIFDCKEIDMTLPECAKSFSSVACEKCGESAPEHKMRLQDGKKVCMDCFQDYNRGW
jgi:formylmethanofuran dehydrogenase subunit E